jgi:predicted PurR-regulated permease PerM
MKESTGGRWSMRPTIILAAVIVVLYAGREVFIPLAFAIVLSLVWSPPVNWLQKLRIPRAPAVLMVVILSLAAGGWIGWVILNQLIGVVNELPDYQQNIHAKIVSLSSPGKGPLSRAAENVKQIGKELAAPPTAEPNRPRANARSLPATPMPVQIVEKPTSSLQALIDLVRPFIGPLGIGGIVLIFSVFLLIERRDVRNRLLRLVGLGQLNVMTQALDDATQRVSRYLLLQFAVNAGFGLTVGLGLYFIGLQYAALWGTVAGFLRLVPYVGTLVAGALPLLLSVAVFDGWKQPALVLVLFASLEIVLANWVEPRLYGAHTGVSSLAILVTTVFWTILWGPPGLILSTPLTVCVAVLGRYVPQVSFLHVLLGDEPVLEAETRVYQRLLAMDREEARDVADQFLKERSLLELYDGVFVPALTMAEQDRHKGGLDETRERFIFLSVKEMIAEFSDYTPAAAEVEEPAPAFPGRVLCLPASDEADEIVAAMLAQLLEGHAIPAIAFPVGANTHETLAMLEPQPEDVICLSALPPFAFAQAKTVARQLRLKFPKTKVLIGVWGFAGDAQKALDRFEPPRPDRFLTSLTEAVEHFGGGLKSAAD